MPAPAQLALVAGEASGDLLAGMLLGGLRQRWPQLSAVGIGGPRMAEQGFQAWWPHHLLAVHGYADALLHYREIAGVRRQLARRLLERRPDAFIGVDAPDFNLGLEMQLRRQGIKTIHFVSPSIWAWRGGRVKKIARAVDHMLCLFPFEPALYERHGIAATYVGHPLADAIDLHPDRAGARQALNLGATDEVVALLPGSRTSEIRHLLPRFLQAAELLRKQRPHLRFVLPMAGGHEVLIRSLVQAGPAGLDVHCVPGQSHAVLAACDVTLIASGTATLEAALFKRPMVIAYHMSALSWQLMKRMRYQPWVGLPNILCESFVVPELLQAQASPQRLAEETLGWLREPQRVAAVQERFMQLHRRLRCNTVQRAVDAIATVLQA